MVFLELPIIKVLETLKGCSVRNDHRKIWISWSYLS